MFEVRVIDVPKTWIEAGSPLNFNVFIAPVLPIAMSPDVMAPHPRGPQLTLPLIVALPVAERSPVAAMAPHVRAPHPRDPAMLALPLAETPVVAIPVSSTKSRMAEFRRGTKPEMPRAILSVCWHTRRFDSPAVTRS